MQLNQCQMPSDPSARSLTPGHLLRVRPLSCQEFVWPRQEKGSSHVLLSGWGAPSGAVGSLATLPGWKVVPGWRFPPHRRCHVSQKAGNLPDVEHFSEQGFLPYVCSYQQGFASEIQITIGCRMPEDPPPSAAVLCPFAPWRNTSNRLGLCSLLVFIPEIGWDFIIPIPSDVQPLMFS